jgi:hypothetical protein
MPKPYVGITGFKTEQQAKTLFLEASADKRRLMVGVLASQRTIMRDQYDPAWREPNRRRIASIFPHHGGYNLIHYYTKDQTNLREQLTRVIKFSGRHCSGLQLNMAWPAPDVLRRFQDSFPEKELVIQLGGRLWPLTDFEPRELAMKVLNFYDGIANYVLLDPSGGLGKELDVAMLTPYLESLEAHLSVARHPIGIAIAGGLCADNLEIIRPLCEQFPGLSFDAEAKLHSGPGQLDLDHCIRYLRVASTLP